MNHCVPDFEMNDNCSAPGFSTPKRPAATGEEEIMELLWQNGQVVVHTQNQRLPKKNGGESANQVEREILRPSSAEEHQHLFMQEDEMASWLHYPLDDSSFDRDLYTDFLCAATPPPPPPLVSTITQTRPVAEIRPPPAPPRPPPNTKPENSPRLQNFMHFSRLPNRPRTEPMNQPSITTARESTVVESNETPAVDPRSRIFHSAVDSRPMVHAERGAGIVAGTTAVTEDLATGARDDTMMSSPGGSGASYVASGEMRKHPPPPSADNRKRKAREINDNECHSEDIEFEAVEAKKQARGSTSTKRSRAAEVHNQSERRRRDRINEKMKALQELIPRCNKSDKASMLDEAIEYLKSLQLQVQMMSMGCGIVPMMYPGMQQYMPAMGLGMGMGMSMDMGMNRPMVPFPAMLPGSTMPPSVAAAHMGPRFPIPGFHIPQHDPSRPQPPNPADPATNPHISHNPNQPRMTNFVDPYQQFLGLHPAQLSLPQNHGTVQPPGSSKPSSSKDPTNPNNNQQRGG